MELECSVCLEPYDLLEHVPRILPCSGAHDVCSACVKELRPAGAAFACPQCRDDIPASARINENRLLVQALRQRRHGATPCACYQAAEAARQTSDANFKKCQCSLNRASAGCGPGCVRHSCMHARTEIVK